MQPNYINPDFQQVQCSREYGRNLHLLAPLATGQELGMPQQTHLGLYQETEMPQEMPEEVPQGLFQVRPQGVRAL